MNKLHSGIIPRNEETLRHTTEQIAEMHWWLAHSMPYCRGSAGIADMFSKVLFDATGIEVPCWKNGLAPDMEAFITPLSEYKEQYHHFFEKELTWSNSSDTFVSSNARELLAPA